MAQGRIDVEFDRIEHESDTQSTFESVIDSVFIIIEGIHIIFRYLRTFSVNFQPIASIQTQIDHHLDFPDINMEMGQSRNFNVVIDCTCRSIHVVAFSIGIGLELITVLTIVEPDLYTEIRHIVKHLLVVGEGDSKLMGSEESGILSCWIEVYHIERSSIGDSYHTVVIDEQLLVDVQRIQVGICEGIHCEFNAQTVHGLHLHLSVFPGRDRGGHQQAECQ